MRNFKSTVFVALSILVIGGILFGPVSISRAQSIQNWSDPVNLSNSGSASDPLLVVDGRGVLHVLWVDEFDGYKYSASADGLTWSAPKIVRYPFSPDDFQPVFLVDPRGPIYMFWLTEKNDLRYAQSLPANFDNPGAWGPVITLDTSVYDFDVALDVESGFHVNYIRNPVTPATGPAGVYYRRSQSGSAWSNAVVLYESQYFRSLEPENAHVRIEASNGNVYAVWDDRSLKRVFMARSNDSGIGWSVPVELIVPQANLGFKTPINIEIGKFNNNILLMWQVGDPGIRCTQFSQWSADGGESWTDPVKMLGEFITCPDKSEFLFVTEDYVMALFNIQGNLSLIAWNGEAWSIPDVQSGLSVMSNPKTFDLITFGCQQITYHGNALFVVGCDQGSSGDIWFTSRPLDPVEILFPLPSDWGVTGEVTLVAQQIPSLTLVTDWENNIHALWTQAAASGTGPFEPRILYARWNGTGWTSPAPVMTDLGGLPGDLSVTIDTQQRLLLTWVNKNTGDLMFSWANSSRANIPSEWTVPLVVPSPSSVNSSPDILVDALNHVVIAYAVTLNEERGIYMVYSNDVGDTWSSPIQVFDAVSAGWEAADRPKLSLTGDGRLHVLFTRYSVLGGQTANGLFYSQSDNGGGTWSAPGIISEQTILWSGIAGTNAQEVHRLWQEKDRAATVAYHQLSRDGGATWESPVKISSVDAFVTEPALTMTGSGNLHFLQLVAADVPYFQEWGWSGDRWRTLNIREINVKDHSVPVSVNAGITSGGVLSAFLLFERDDPIDGYTNQLMNTFRVLEAAESARFAPIAVLPSPETAPLPIVPIELQPTATSAPPLGIQEVPPPLNKNVLGLVLLGVVVVTLLIFTIPGRKKSGKPDDGEQ